LEEDSLGVLRIGAWGARVESIMIPCVLPETCGGVGWSGVGAASDTVRDTMATVNLKEDI